MDKEPQDGETATSSETITSPQDTHQSNRDLSQDHDARDAPHEQGDFLIIQSVPLATHSLTYLGSTQ